jgi:hypothetical protein
MALTGVSLDGSPMMGGDTLLLAACRVTPFRRSSPHRFPAGSFIGGFPTPAPYRVDCPHQAGIRNPNRKRPFDWHGDIGSTRPKGTFERSGYRRHCRPP